jgi:hypothetical protein
MLDEYGNLIQVTRIATPHELGQALDELDGLRPMAVARPVVRVPPPFPLSAYLVMKRAE